MRKFFDAACRIALVALVATSVFPLVPTAVTRAAAPNWDVTGNYTFRFNLTGDGANYDHSVSLTQDASGAITSGDGYFPAGSSTPSHTWDVTAGSVSGDDIEFTVEYLTGAVGTTMTVTGTVSAGGVMSGTWTDNYAGSRTGTWQTIDGGAVPEPPTNTVIIYGDTAAGENQPGWLFNRDTSTSTPFAFVSGNPSIGSGSLEVLPIGANPSDKMIAENFINTPISEVETISFDFKLGAGNASREEQVYMNFYMNFGSSDPLKYYDCRYDLVATVGSESSYTTLTFDPNVAPQKVTTRNDSPATCPTVPAAMGSDANLRMFTLTMGDSSVSDIDMSGYFDNVVVKTTSGTTIYDFEPEPPRTPSVVEINKVWQNASGQEVHAPSNAGDITITVTTENGNDDECTYNANGELECDGPVNSHIGETIDVEETGMPAGWTVDPTTIGKDITPVCPNVDEDVKGAVECTHTIINKQNTPQPCATELVVNGGFETPNVENNAKWDVFKSGTNGLGWSVEWINSGGANRPDKANIEIHKDGVVSGWEARDGDQYTELDSDWGGPGNSQTGEDASVKIYQDLITKVGGNYTLTFWASPRPNQSTADNAIQVKIGDETHIINSTTSSTTSWSKYTYTFETTAGVTRLEFSDAGAGNSFGGFLDNVSVVEDCLSDVQICKYNVDQTPLPGWSVFLKGPKTETVQVEPDGQMYYSQVLPAGKYVLEASGTYVYRGSVYETDAVYSERLPGDAVYALADPIPWVNVNLFPGSSEGNLGVRANGSTALWGSEFHSNHEYSGTLTLNADSKIDFQILDNYYDDNTGHIDVDIFPIYEGVTGSDGCVIIKDVPFETSGTSYTLGEVMQDGWENVSGDGERVTVDGVDDSFSLTNKCTGDDCVIPCNENNLGWASDYIVGETSQGNRKDGGPVLTSRSDPNSAVGVADWTSGTQTNFYSLGFGGVITLSFTGYVNNISGDDLRIHEATNGTYPDELVKIEVSQDGIDWKQLTSTASNGVTNVDFGETGLDWIQYIRLTDISDPADFPNGADGFDLDAVEAITETCQPPVVEDCYQYDFAASPQPTCYNISGNVYHDQSVLGDNTGDDGLSSWKVYIDENGNDLFDSGEPFDDTDENGDYMITDVRSGCYTVREVLGSGYANGIEPEDNEYRVGVGGVHCGESLLRSLFIKTAHAATMVMFPGDATGLDFGNVLIDNSSGGSGSRTTGSSSGSQPL